MNSKFLFLITILGLFLYSCKNDPADKEGALIKRIVQILPGRRAPVEAFIYDSQKRLTAIRYLDSSSLYDNDIEYDAQSRLSKISYSYIGTEIYSCSFVYNEKGQIIKKITKNDPGYDACNNESYTYNDKGQLISDTTYDKQTNTVYYYVTYKYDSNGNIIEDNFRYFFDPSSNTKTVYTFDNNRNPLHIQGSDYFYIQSNTAFFNKNNIIYNKLSAYNAITTKYEYQINGLPTQYTVDNPNISGGLYHSTYVFEYE